MKKAESRRARAMTGVCPHCGGKLTGEPAVMARHRYALRRRRGLWLVVFDGEETQFKHEKGAEYVARLLAERGPFHALDLASKTGGGGLVQRTHRSRTEASLRELVDIGGTVQERSASLDEAEARRALIVERRR